MSALQRMIARSLAIARFALTTHFRSWLTRGGILAGAAVILLGPALSAREGGGWTFDADIGFMGFFIMALFAVRTGLAEQRELELTTFIRHNLASRGEHAVGLATGLFGTWLVLCGVTFVVMLLARAGDVTAAGWTTASWGLRLLVVLGFVPLVEAVSSLRVPLIVPAFAYMGLLVVLSIAMPEDQAMALFIPVERGDVGALGRLAVQAAVFAAATTALFLTTSIVGPTLRRRLRQIVAFRH